MVKFFNLKKKDGSNYVAPIDMKIRDISDTEAYSDNPVTFATPYANEEQEKELREFAKDKAEEFKEEIDQGFIENPLTESQEGLESATKAVKIEEKIEQILQEQPSSKSDEQDEENFWKDMTKEIVRIKEDETITTDDKLILLFNIHEGYDGAFPKEIENELVNLMTILDARLQNEKRATQETAKEEKIRSKVQGLRDKVKLYREKARKPSNNSSSEYSRSEKSDEEDWDGPYSVLIAEAELM